MIIPTIGRVILVHRGNSDQGEPALISYVWHERMINVGGFDKNGVPFSACGLELVQDDMAPANQDFYAEWMPYQKQQAAKEELK